MPAWLTQFGEKAKEENKVAVPKRTKPSARPKCDHFVARVNGLGVAEGTEVRVPIVQH
jgi:hypothetical protein